MRVNSVAFKHEVSHEWERTQHVREYRAGHLGRDEVCDADFLLRAAAEHHGRTMDKPCPVCGENLRLTRWVYGESLGRRAGSARSEQEIAEFVGEGLEFTVHEVEVCRHCRWNHLLRSATAFNAC
ncbi:MULTISPECIES: DUF5318 family protein [unclassified Corynebacterium]|uniref:DUF5318 family protein n=1 Tax=Corynebacterium TaxID=1716 RepID=UPI002550AAD9|nr:MULTISPECIES: DUF5318 family protein [unclassified Corynebacterium]MDK8453040.1 DUF5318 family protein [Corynebacterium sp. MSK084]MDK8468217.1 DUF5318 family protein [Corynebacterium sp. MSK130]MDK8477158.1 DUF5318 family protein [Corynebacterium sp. MSK310]MDK8492594.1 DUF5318 family protein [Corynebacterium sp. MSK175]MDK8514948.1 DUF5318 family protein [Corynebacterium sp. MSK123]